MRVLNNTADDTGLTVTTLERGHDEDLLAYETAGFYKVGPYVISGHDVGCIQRVAWDAVAQEWKVVR